MSFFHKMHFTSYCVTVQLAVCSNVERILYTGRHVAVSFFNVCVCAFNFTIKIKYLVVAVLQCSCRFLYVHPCLSSHGVCSCVCVRVYLWMLDCLQIWRLVACSFEGWRNLRGRLKYCAVIGIALSSVSSINVQFSI